MLYEPLASVFLEVFKHKYSTGNFRESLSHTQFSEGGQTCDFKLLSDLFDVSGIETSWIYSSKKYPWSPW